MLDANTFKHVMRQYATGVMVLTVRDGAGFHAATVNSVTSVSLAPVLLLVCLEKNARSHALIHAVGTFALNILAATQVELGKKFSYDRAARSAPQEHAAGTVSARGEFLLDDSPAYLECRVVAEYAGGDHTIFLAEVTDANVQADNADPLLYYHSQWRT